MLGMNSNENIPSPHTSNGPATGKCIILNKIPSPVKEPDNAPEINANFFIFI